jgi:DNA topoisomerase-1
MVGFYVSPFLWKSISYNKENGLSAGRCQTPALRLVYDNQKDMDAHPGVMTYDVTGYFTQHMIPFELNQSFSLEDEAVDFLHACMVWEFLLHLQPVACVKKAPPEPFSTSRLQQTASNELHMSPQETMNVCQKLYEAGYITYMRTDAKKYSVDFINQANDFVLLHFGEKYVDATNVDRIGLKDNEDNPHESIRPTKLSLCEVPESFTTREKKLYKLIWENSVESCMAAATYFSLSFHGGSATKTVSSYQ